jgi:RNA polymerase sigma-70 factor (ECF subfamily)
LSTGLTHNETLLLKQISEGDDIAFREIFDIYRDRFYGVAFKMSASAYTAEEIVQEVFIALWKSRILVADVEKPSSYLFSIFYRCLYQHYKREAIEQKLKRELAELDAEDEENAIMEKSGKENQYQLLEKAMLILPPQQAMVYRLSKLEGLSRDQVAAKMGISPNTVRNHLAEAIKTLKDFVRKTGIILIILGDFFTS